MIVILLASLLTGFVLTYLVIPSVVSLSGTKKLFDCPDKRKLNKVDVPTLGGVGIFIGLTVSSILFIQPGNAWELRYLLLAVIIMFFVGITDDMLVISARKKFILEIVTGLILVLLGDFRITLPYGLFNAELFCNGISVPLSVLMFVFLINAMNLIDGIDGLAAGVALIVSLFLGIWFFLAGHFNYAVVCMALTGSLAAYLRFNVFGRKNKIFMGDTGSLILGVFLAAMVIRFNELNMTAPEAVRFLNPPQIVLGMMIVPVTDTLRVFIIRLRHGRSPFSPDMNHFHHLLIKTGMNHIQATAVLIAYMIFFTLLAILLETAGVDPNIAFPLLLAMSFSFVGLLVAKTRRMEEKHAARLMSVREDFPSDHPVLKEIPGVAVKETVAARKETVAARKETVAARKETRKMRVFSLLLLALLLGLTEPVVAQQQVSSVNVESLTDEQIRQIVNEVNSRGLTVDQAAELARMRGATQLQIDQVKQRIQQMQLSQPQEAAASSVPVVQPEAPSEPAYRKEKADATLKNKKLFGYQLFNQDNLTFEPSVNIPVPPDYVLGIGDQVVIHVWGASQQTYMLQIDNNGAVNIPGLGPVGIANQNLAYAKQTVIRRLTAIYDGMSGTAPDTFADLSVNDPRSIKVNVIGEAITPGTYTLPATASAFNALYLSGGPNENGSFRNIRIIRDNKILSRIDVYEYLIRGNTSNNVSLRDQDIIFIPTYKKRVQTTGTFKRNAIFELKEGENIQQIIEFTGGFREEASRSRLLLTRFDNDQYALQDIDRSAFDTLELRNGDVIRAEQVIDRFENRLTIEGAVFRPGSYALEKGMTLLQLINKAGGLREDYFANRGLIIRLDEKLYPTILPFDLEEVLLGKNDPALCREDHVVIRDIFSIGEKKIVRIYGEVMRPGEYDFQRNMTLKDLVFMAGGMTEAASESYIEVARRNTYEEAREVDSKMATLFQFRIDRKLELSGEDADFGISPFDYVYIRRAPSYEPQQTVYIRGEVKYPGQYSISSKEERISDLINRAGGLTPYAFIDGAKLKRKLDDQLKEQNKTVGQLKEHLDSNININANKAYADLELRLESILEKPHTPYDYFLRDGDEVLIPLKSEEIWIRGEVLNPMGLAWEKGRSLKYYVNRSGGFSTNAKGGKAYVVYSNGTTQVTKGILFKNYPVIEPGSQIIIPARPERKHTDNTTKWLAITSAFSSLAIAIATVFK
ncbi:MAG: SLBB domain-containing protein [Mangrovibacterium sp.]